MKTVLYFEYVRNHRRYIRSLVGWLLSFFVLFSVCVVIDKVLPSFNLDYFRWPDMIKKLFGLPPWSNHLYINIWQLVALVFPFYWLHTLMTRLAESVREEDRLETIVFLHNMSISRGAVLLAKGTSLLVVNFVFCFSLAIENVLFLFCIGRSQMVSTVVIYYVFVLLTGVLGLGIAAFVTSCSRKASVCRSVITWLLTGTFCIARVHAFLQFLSDLLVETNRSGVLSTTLNTWAEKLEVLSVLSPVVWCWPSVSFDIRYACCGILIFLICVVIGSSIYVNEKVMDVK